MSEATTQNIFMIFAKKAKPILPYFSLPLILLTCIALWTGLAAERHTEIYSENGIWDLRSFDFANGNARLMGTVEFIPSALLTPTEFAERQDEVVIGYVHEAAEYATSRVRLLMPADAYYTFSRISTDFADRIFVNGLWLHDVGVPATNLDDIIPFTERVTFTVRPENVDGYYIIEIIQQTANLGMRGRGVFPQHWRIGGYSFYQTILRADFSVNIVLGAYIALALSFMLLFFHLKNYRSNLYFALLCLIWFLRTGVTSSARAFAVLVPWLPGVPSMRIEFVAMPIAAILILAIIRDLFPGILHRHILPGIKAVSTVFAIIILFADAAVIGHVILVCQIFYLPCIIYIIVRFAMKLRKPSREQIIFVAGAFLFLYGAVRDFTYYSFQQFSLPPFDGTNLTQITMLAFAFCQAIAMFIATMKKVEQSKINEQRALNNERLLAADNAALDSLNRMKAQFLGNMSHEIKTPLAVILGDIQRIEWELKKHGFENERIDQSINRSQSEVKRIARVTESAIKMSSMQESNEEMVLLDASLIFSVGAEAYRSIIEKQGNTLTMRTEKDLPQILGNADMLIGVLSNLLTNANKHTKNGEIILQIENYKVPADGPGSGKQFVRVAVLDTGSGILPELLPQIFERGISGSDSTGMGLAISKQTIEAHGGTINIESPQGKGTIVTFKIPAYKVENNKEGLVERDV